MLWLAPGLGMAWPAAAAEQLPLWELGFGLAGLHLPHYRGAAQAYNGVLPVPYAVYRGEWLRADRDGARAVLFDSDRVDLDLSLFATPPTRSSNNEARSGMPNLAATLEIGPNLQFRLARQAQSTLTLRLPVRAAITLQSHPRSIGWVATPNLNFDLRHGPWNIGMLAGPLFATSGFNGYFYNVTEQQATASRPAYQARGGYAGWQATLGASRRFDAHWFGAFVRLDSVAGATFADSPLVRQNLGITAGLAWSWAAWQSDRRVPDRSVPP